MRDGDQKQDVQEGGWNNNNNNSNDNDDELKNGLTTSTARAALSIRHGSISAGDQRAGDFAAHGDRVLERRTEKICRVDWLSD